MGRVAVGLAMTSAALLAGTACGETGPKPLPDTMTVPLPAQLSNEACAQLGRIIVTLPNNENPGPEFEPRNRLDAGEAVTRLARTITDDKDEMPKFSNDIPQDLIRDVNNLYTDIMSVVDQRGAIKRTREEAKSLSDNRCFNVKRGSQGNLHIAPVDHPQLPVEICNGIDTVKQALGNYIQEVTPQNSLAVYREVVNSENVSDKLMGTGKPGNFRWLPGTVESRAWQMGVVGLSADILPDDAIENATEVQQWAAAVYDASCVAPVTA